jgi:hypothetical protein
VKPGQKVFVSCANSPIAKRICLTYQSELTRGDSRVRAAHRSAAYCPLRKCASLLLLRLQAVQVSLNRTTHKPSMYS